MAVFESGVSDKDLQQPCVVTALDFFLQVPKRDQEQSVFIVGRAL
jgi:hypothetical protein